MWCKSFGPRLQQIQFIISLKVGDHLSDRHCQKFGHLALTQQVIRVTELRVMSGFILEVWYGHILQLWYRVCLGAVVQIIPSSSGAGYVLEVWSRVCLWDVVQIFPCSSGAGYILELWYRVCPEAVVQIIPCSSGTYYDLDLSVSVYSIWHPQRLSSSMFSFTFKCLISRSFYLFLKHSNVLCVCFSVHFSGCCMIFVHIQFVMLQVFVQASFIFYLCADFSAFACIAD